jgi:hypothetical protein
MPDVQRKDIPRALMEHLVDRVHDREVAIDDLQNLARWLDSKPNVPDGAWFKRFPTMTVCGHGALVKTFLTSSQYPVGEEQ